MREKIVREFWTEGNVGFASVDGHIFKFDSDRLEEVKSIGWRYNKLRNKLIIRKGDKTTSLAAFLYPNIKLLIIINNDRTDLRLENIQEGYRETIIDGDICRIPLQDGREAICDADLYDKVKDKMFHVDKTNLVKSGNGKNNSFSLRQLAFPEVNFVGCVEYINGNKLDYRRCNLRDKIRVPYIVGDVCHIPLPGDREALCDAKDFDKVAKYNWSIRKSGYPFGWVNQKTTAMHKYLYPEIELLDHINLIKTDNRSCNVRPATFRQNLYNKPVRKDNVTGYKGVHKTPYNKYQAAVQKDKIPYRIGTFETAIEAAKAYDKKAKELFGEFASLNFPEEKGDLDW